MMEAVHLNSPPPLGVDLAFSCVFLYNNVIKKILWSILAKKKLVRRVSEKKNLFAKILTTPPSRWLMVDPLAMSACTKYHHLRINLDTVDTCKMIAGGHEEILRPPCQVKTAIHQTDAVALIIQSWLLVPYEKYQCLHCAVAQWLRGLSVRFDIYTRISGKNVTDSQQTWSWLSPTTVPVR